MAALDARKFDQKAYLGNSPRARGLDILHLTVSQAMQQVAGILFGSTGRM